MALGLSAPSDVVQFLSQLRRDSTKRAIYEALSALILRIRTQPDAPGTKSAAYQLEDGAMARVVVLPIREAGETWALVWTLDERDPDEPCVRVERIEKVGEGR